MLRTNRKQYGTGFAGELAVHHWQRRGTLPTRETEETTMNVSAMVLVGVGGAVGSILRYAVAQGFQNRLPDASFPWGTLVVNLVGCFCIGVFGGIVAKQPVSPELRLTIVTGLLGGFTTFSAFGLESLELMTTKPILSLLYIAASTCCGIFLAGCGWGLGFKLA